MLPTLPIATSLEHGGFRGSFSLKPETAMQVVRDLADELQAQGFTRLIVLNGHGGNFYLVPVCRDINRADRPIKILIANPWEHGGETSTPGADGRLDLHAGRWETSLMPAV
ncbi:MAG: creatininase family protein, partial [Desulfovibrionaceae bacterium]